MLIDDLIKSNPAADPELLREAFLLGQKFEPQGTVGFAWQKFAGPMWVPGEPVPTRYKARSLPNGVATIYMPDKFNGRRGAASGWKSAVECFTLRYRPAAPLNCPVRVDLDVYCPRPQKLMRRKDPDGPVLNSTKPDRDNYAKLIVDAMTNAGWFYDDGRVCDGPIRKLYHGKTGKPGASITVYVLADDQQDLFVSSDELH
ncbi:MAG: RusA family crossover junction endodeoxyribonuclease [Planctomycetota bacterium]